MAMRRRRTRSKRGTARKKKPPKPIWLQLGPAWVQTVPPQWIQIAIARGKGPSRRVRVRYRPGKGAASSSIVLAYGTTKRKLKRR